MTVLIFVRHGESEANKSHFFAGHTDVALEEKGLEQAKVTAEYIAANYKVDKVYASDLKRAYATGKCIADITGAEITAHSGLREIYGGEWEGKGFDILQTEYKEEYDVWLADIGSAMPRGGESVKQLGERVFSAVQKIAQENDGKTVVIASHGAAIKAAQAMMRFGSVERMNEVEWTTNASVTVFEYDGDAFRCVVAGYDKHLGKNRTEFPANV